jgi:hypothetical protein
LRSEQQFMIERASGEEHHYSGETRENLEGARKERD